MKQISENSWVFDGRLGLLIEPFDDKTIISVTYEGSVLPFVTRNVLTPQDRDLLVSVIGEEGLEYFPVDSRPYDPEARKKLVQRLKSAGVNL
jgi:hypothetical protein